MKSLPTKLNDELTPQMPAQTEFERFVRNMSRRMVVSFTNAASIGLVKIVGSQAVVLESLVSPPWTTHPLRIRGSTKISSLSSALSSSRGMLGWASDHKRD